jgi:hypothetical protein
MSEIYAGMQVTNKTQDSSFPLTQRIGVLMIARYLPSELIVVQCERHESSVASIDQGFGNCSIELIMVKMQISKLAEPVV